MKQNLTETECNQCFRKDVKNMSTKQESVTGVIFKARPFSSVFNFGCKDGWVTAAICNYCQLVVSQSDKALCKFLLIPVVAKNSMQKTSPCMKTSLISCETSLFSYFEMWLPLTKCGYLFLYYFLLSCLLDGCYQVAFYTVVTTILVLQIQSIVIQSQNNL